jgi:hypothetical protein
MLLLQRIAHTSMTRGKDSLPLAAYFWRIQFHLHQLIHVLQSHHIAVELHDSFIFDEAEGCKLAPAIVEARIIGIVFPDFREEIFDALFWDSARFQSGVPLWWEGIGVESNEGIFGVLFFEGVVEGEEAGEVGGIGYEGRPD